MDQLKYYLAEPRQKQNKSGDPTVTDWDRELNGPQQQKQKQLW